MASRKKTSLETLAETAKTVGGNSNPVTVTLKDGSKVDIFKCKTRDVGVVLEVIAYALDQLGVTSVDATKNINLDNPTLFLQVISKSAGKVLAVASRLCSMTEDGLNDLELDDSIIVLTEIFKVNKDFFLKSILPLVRGALPAGKLSAG